MTGGEPENEPTSQPGGNDSIDRTRRPDPVRSDPQATVFDAAAQPANPRPTEILAATDPTQILPPPGNPGLPPPVLAPPNPSTRSGSYPGARWFHGIAAGVAWSALLLQLLLVILNHDSTTGVVTAIVNYFSFFTILSNILVAVMMTALAMNPIRESAAFGPLRLDSLLMITITGLVYLIVLAPLWNPQGWQAVADYGLHYVVPLLVLVGYGVFGPRPRLSFGNILPALAIPAVWIGYTLIRGAIVNWYPYPFIDVDKHGYGMVTINILVILVIALVLAVGFILLDKKLPWAPRR
jgi:hypothetical protein